MVGARAQHHILASKGKLHRAMRETIAKAWPEADRREAEGRAAPQRAPATNHWHPLAVAFADSDHAPSQLRS
jgi:hypothetical protein